MKFGTAIGIVISIVGIAIGATMEGTNVMVVINVPAILIVLVGTLGATIAACGLEANLRIPKLYMKAFNAEPPDLNGRVTELVGYAEQARRDGLLALDEQLSSIEDPYTRKGLQLVVDGTDPELVREILEAEIDGMEHRHKEAVAPFVQAGGFGPTLGVLGTVASLVHVLENLDKPETLGPSISAAFIATLLGVGAANIVLLPVAERLKQLSDAEVQARVLVLDGILAIQSGDNPRVIEEKLISFVPPDEREDEGDDAGADAPGPQLRAVEDDQAMAA